MSKINDWLVTEFEGDDLHTAARQGKFGFGPEFMRRMVADDGRLLTWTGTGCAPSAQVLRIKGVLRASSLSVPFDTSTVGTWFEHLDNSSSYEIDTGDIEPGKVGVRVCETAFTSIPKPPQITITDIIVRDPEKERRDWEAEEREQAEASERQAREKEQREKERQRQREEAEAEEAQEKAKQERQREQAEKKAQQEVERQRQIQCMRLAQRQCKMCGRELPFLDRFLKREAHPTCSHFVD